MSFARITYVPQGMPVVTIDFPEELSAWSGPLRNAVRQTNESEGGVFMVHFEHFEDECVATLEKMPFSASFINTMTAFWSHAARGGKFTFSRNGFPGRTTVRIAVAAGATLVPVASSALLVVGRRAVLESTFDGWQQEAGLIAARDASSPPSMTMTNPLIFGWAVGDVVSTEFNFRDCMLSDDQWPITEEANGLQMTLRLRFRTFYDRAVVVEPS